MNALNAGQATPWEVILRGAQCSESDVEELGVPITVRDSPSSPIGAALAAIQNLGRPPDIKTTWHCEGDESVEYYFPQTITALGLFGISGEIRARHPECPYPLERAWRAGCKEKSSVEGRLIFDNQLRNGAPCTMLVFYRAPEHARYRFEQLKRQYRIEEDEQEDYDLWEEKFNKYATGWNSRLHQFLTPASLYDKMEEEWQQYAQCAVEILRAYNDPAIDSVEVLNPEPRRGYFAGIAAEVAICMNHKPTGQRGPPLPPSEPRPDAGFLKRSPEERQRRNRNQRIRHAIQACLPSLMMALGLYLRHRHAAYRDQVSLPCLPERSVSVVPALPEPIIPELPGALPMPPVDIGGGPVFPPILTDVRFNRLIYVAGAAGVATVAVLALYAVARKQAHRVAQMFYR